MLFLFSMYYKALYIVLVLLYCFDTAAQNKLLAVPSKTVINPNETVQVQYIVEGAMQADEFVAPSFRNFEQIGEVIQTNGWTWVNGSLTEYLSYTYLLRPKIKGKLSIASAVIKVKGHILSSPIVSINVTDAVNVNRDVTASSIEEKPDYYLEPQEDAKEKIRKNLFVKATVDKQTCYTGEALLATFKLYTRLDSESKILKRPSFNGFSVIDLEEPETGIFTKEKVNGVLYNCYLIRKVQLFPLQSGEVVIEPVQINNRVRFIRGAVKDGKEWMDALTNKEKRKEAVNETIIEEELITETTAIHVNVLDLPQQGKPEHFNGAVGNFTIKSQLLNNEFTADESGVLKVELSGSGNLNMVNAPAIAWPKGIEVFDPVVHEEINKAIAPVNGIKVFKIPFTAAKGAYQLPPVVFSFFDVVSKTYKTISTDSLVCTVKEALQKKGNPLRLPLVNSVKTTSSNKTLIAISAALLFLLALFIYLLQKNKKKKKEVPVLIKEEPKVETPASAFITTALQVKNSLHSKQFYSHILNGLQDFLTDRFHLQEQKVNRNTLEQLLKQKYMLQEAVLWSSIANRCEEALFSPVDLNISKDELVKDAEAFMRRVDEKTIPQ
jgi:BatD DUF11 like domain